MFGLALVLAAATAASAAAAATEPEIRGETVCPTPAAVSAVLKPLVPRSARTPGSPQLVLLAAQGETVVVRLFGDGLQLLDERRLPPSLPCDERARAAAVVIASWLTPLPQVTPPPIDVGAGKPGAAVTHSSPGGASTGRVLFAASAAALASLTIEGVAPGLFVEGSVRPRGAAWSLSLEGLFEGAHRQAVGGGEATWRRLGIGLSGGRRWARGRRRVEVRVGLLLTRLDIQGSRFSDNRSGVSTDVGGAASTRAGISLGAVQPWVGLWAVGWVGTQRLDVTGVVASAEIPRAEALLGLGATFGGHSETF